MAMAYLRAVMAVLIISLGSFNLQLVGLGKEPAEKRVVINSNGWKIVGDLLVPKSNRPVPAVILLNKAAGDRRVYERLARHLADNGIASLRVDLRGHGDSINKGKFIPGNEGALTLIEGTEEDVTSAFRYLKTVPGVDAQKIGFVGASYSGEGMAVSARKYGYGKAYVALSPGSFSEESMEAIDPSGIPWLFVKSTEEGAKSLKAFFPLLRQKSRTAQIIEVAGTEHATDILSAHVELTEMIAVWFKYHLRSGSQLPSNNSFNLTRN
jgi:dienelactone hydrolase